MTYEALFDGDEHWLELDASPGWHVPFLLTDSLVRQADEGEVDRLESPSPGMTSREGQSGGHGFWAGEDGWSAFSIMLQAVCEALELPVDVVQEVVRDSAWNVTGKFHRVRIGRLSDDGQMLFEMPEGV